VSGKGWKTFCRFVFRSKKTFLKKQTFVRKKKKLKLRQNSFHSYGRNVFSLSVSTSLRKEKREIEKKYEKKTKLKCVLSL
jgi:hypothetical protein